MPIITEFELNINKEFVLHTLDCRTDSESYDEVSETFDKLKYVALKLVKPKAIYEIKNTEYGYLSEELKDAEYTVYAMYTLGGDISAEVTKYFDEGLYLEGMMLDHMADNILGGSLGKALGNYIIKECTERGLGITKMLTPAEQIPIQTQTIIAKELDAYNNIDIGISSGFMIDPVKSSSFILGADKNLPFREIEHDCEKCAIITCRWRNFNYLKEKHSEVKPVAITVHSGKETNIINSDTSKDILSILRENKIYIPAVCAGNGTCGKCKIRTSTDFAVSESDIKSLNENEIKNGIRIACSAYPISDMIVEILQKDNKFDIVTEYVNTKTNVKKK